jgi:hypothetical protein
VANPYVVQEPPPARPRRRWVIPVVIVSIIVVLALLAAAIFIISSFVADRFGIDTPDQPLIAGESGSPDAIDPLVCPDACFTEASIEGLLPSEADLKILGVSEATYPNGTYDPATAGQLFRSDSAGWETYEGEPDSCFFAPANSPVAGSLESGDPQSTDLIYFLGTHEDLRLLNTLDLAARIFPDTASATAYLEELAHSIEACPGIEIGPPGERYSAEIDPAAAMTVPDSIAAVGWIRTGDPGPRWRAYIMDIQRGNLVVRARLLTNGIIREVEFREFVDSYIAQLAELEVPAAPAS